MPPTWTTDVPQDPRGKAFPLLRTPTNGKLIAAVTSENLIGTDTHFYGGHTIPCERPDCEACRNGMPFIYHGYVSAVQVHTRLHFLFEFTAQAADSFKHYYKAHGTLRGCRMEATRMHSRPNGRVILTCSPLDQQAHKLPEPPDVAACMAIIWNLPAGQIETHRQLKDSPGMTNTHQTLGRFNGGQKPALYAGDIK